MWFVYPCSYRLPLVPIICQSTGSPFDQVMACRLVGLAEPMLAFCHLKPQEQTSVKFKSKYYTFHSWKCIWKCHLRNDGHFVRGGRRLTDTGAITWVPQCEVTLNNKGKINRYNYGMIHSKHSFKHIWHWNTKHGLNQHNYSIQIFPQYSYIALAFIWIKLDLLISQSVITDNTN